MQAKDIMTHKVICVNPDDTIFHAIRLMLHNKISGLPVVDKDDYMVGIVTEGDFLRRAEVGTTHQRSRWIEFLLGPGALSTEYVHANARKVAEVMTTDIHSVNEDTPLDEVVDCMERYHIKRIPVRRQNKIVGIIGRGNILRAVAGVGLASAIAAKITDDAEIRRQLVDYLDKQPWAPTGTINVEVENGVVTFTGAILDDRYRDALRVAAENAPGVRGVVDQMVWIDPDSGYVGERPMQPKPA